MSKSLRAFIVLAVIASMLSATGLAAANGSVDPASVAAEIYPGEFIEVAKTVTTPAIPPVVDICLLEDETGSFGNDIHYLQDDDAAAALELYDAIVAESPGAQFAVAGFRDYPVYPYGGGGDWVYWLRSSMSADRNAWKNGILALTAGGGADGPEAQYDAIVAAAGPGTFNDPTKGTQYPCGWREEEGVQHVLVVATDAPFHLPGSGKPHVNDAASTLTALGDDIIVIGLKAPGAGTELDDLAAATGGSVQALSSDGANIADAILLALEELTADVWWTEDCGPELDVSLDPIWYEDVLGETMLSFAETIAVPVETPRGEYDCTVTFLSGDYDFPAEGAEIGTQAIHIEVISVPLDIKPTSCPNPINITAKGVLPVAILGAESLDVTTIDPATLRLEGVAPLRWEWSDVATPFEPWTGKSDCWMDCTEAGPDGYMDLTLKFDSQEVIAAMGEPSDGECRVLFLEGNLFDGTAIKGEDVVVFLNK